MSDDNVINMPTPMNVLADKIRSAFHRTERGRFEWIEGTLELAVLLAEARSRFPSNIAFSHWIIDAELESINYDDRAALISIATDLQLARIVLEHTERSSWRWIWEKEMKIRLRQVAKTVPEKSFVSEPAVSIAPPVQSEKPPAPAPAKRIEQYPIKPTSKLRELLSDKIADVLQATFKHSGMFIKLADNKKSCSMLIYLAERCVAADYPDELRQVKTWTPRLLYPNLPQKLIENDKVAPSNLNTLYKHHKILVETERRFMRAPEFGTDKPMLAYNTAYSIYNSVLHAGKGNVFDQTTVHRATYASDEGKPAVYVRGTQLWPAETDAGYVYHDLRCACSLASDILLAYKETRDPPMTTMVLKLRHIRSWLPGGYNAKWSDMTIGGLLKAFDLVIAAYQANKSDLTQTPITLANPEE